MVSSLLDSVELTQMSASECWIPRSSFIFSLFSAGVCGQGTEHVTPYLGCSVIWASGVCLTLPTCCFAGGHTVKLYLFTRLHGMTALKTKYSPLITPLSGPVIVDE